MATHTETRTPHDLLNAMQRHAEFLNLLLSDQTTPGSWLLREVQDAVAERTATAFREVEKELDLEEKRCAGRQFDAEDLSVQFRVLMAKMNAIAQVVTGDFSGTTFCDTERYCVPDPMWWYDGLRSLRADLKPYLDIADRAWEAERASEAVPA